MSVSKLAMTTLLASMLVVSLRARADVVPTDGGSTNLDASASSSDDAQASGSSGDASNGDDASDAATAVPLACGGALCDTTNGSTCDVAGIGLAPRGGGSREAPYSGLGFAACGVLLAFALRRKKSASAAVAGVTIVLASAASPSRASAQTEGKSAQKRSDAPRLDGASEVDVSVTPLPVPRRIVSLAWNPIPLLAIGKLSADVTIAPFEHHAIVLSPFYAKTTTLPIYVFDEGGNAQQLPAQRFEGFGGEIGYRYFTGEGGLRGFFVGPSLVLGSFRATAQNGTATPYAQLGLAADIGYQRLVADRVVLALGAGVEALTTTKSIPNQQFPARAYANGGVIPRLLFSAGWAL